MALRIKPGGHTQIITGYKVEEFHASTCSHCQKITEFPSMKKMHEHVDVCRNCMKLICLSCVGKPCIPWLKQCEIEEALGRKRWNEWMNK